MAIYMMREYVNPRKWPCPDGFHIPTKDEWTTIRGILTTLGLSSWSSITNYLKMPFAWRRINETAALLNQGSDGRYRSSEWNSSNRRAFYFYITSSSSSISDTGTYRAEWFSIRWFKDEPVTPDSSWAALYSNKIYHNSSLWLISISSDGTTRYTIADKNLWAANVWDYGNYYQRWNNYWFPSTWSVTTSSTLVNASDYWPWNYYSSSTFICIGDSPYDRSNVQNDNLRWWEEA